MHAYQEMIEKLCYPELAFDWISVTFFDHWPIRMLSLFSTPRNDLKTAFHFAKGETFHVYH